MDEGFSDCFTWMKKICFLFVHRNRNFNGDDLITMKAKDGTGFGDIRSVEVTVLPVNDPPSITAPFMADLSTLESTSPSNDSVTTLPLPAISVADPDEFDIRSNAQFHHSKIYHHVYNMWVHKPHHAQV